MKAASRNAFIKAAAAKLYVDEETIKRDVGRLLLQLETLQAEQLRELKRPKPVELTEAQRGEAIQLLRDANLLSQKRGVREKRGVRAYSRSSFFAGPLSPSPTETSDPIRWASTAPNRSFSRHSNAAKSSLDSTDPIM